jgi:hypothetical protein
MRGPSTPRGWFCKAIYILDAQGRNFSMQYDRIRGTGPRYSREEALDVKIAAERASHAVCGNGVGYKLMMDFYTKEVSWFAFTEPEQAIIRKTVRGFSRRLREAGLIERKG